MGQAQPRVARVNSGSLHTRSLADGTRVFRLRFNARGRREFMTLHERAGCDCGCGGGWDEQAARRELGETVARGLGTLQAGPKHGRLPAHWSRIARCSPSPESSFRTLRAFALLATFRY